MNKTMQTGIFFFLCFSILSCGVQVPDGPADRARCGSDGNCTYMEWDVDEDEGIVVPPRTTTTDSDFDDEFDNDFDSGRPILVDSSSSGNENDHPPLNPNESSQTNHPIGVVFKYLGDSIGRGLKALAHYAGLVVDTLTGAAQKKANEYAEKKRMLELKIKDAVNQEERIREYEKQISELAKNIDSKAKDLAGAHYHDSISIQDIINFAGQRHNELIENIQQKFQDVDTSAETQNEDTKSDDSCRLKYKSCADLTPEDTNIIEAKDYIDYAYDRIEDFDQIRKVSAKRLMTLAEASVDLGEKAYWEGEIKKGDAYIEIGLNIADAAIGFVPGVGWAHDLYQALAGENLITGEKIGGFDRSIAVLGVLSGGLLSQFKSVFKGSTVLSKLGQIKGLVLDPKSYNLALETGSNYFEYGLDKVSINSLILGFDCLVFHSPAKSRNIIESILGLIEQSAYADAKKPCGDIINGVLDSAGKIGASTAEGVKEYAQVLSKYKIDPPLWPNGINFESNLKKHMSQLDGFTQKTGIKGAHNLSEFESAIANKGAKIVNSVDHPTIPGLKNIDYEIPKLDKELNPIPGEYKGGFTKTVYDPAVFSDGEMLRLGQIASAEAYDAAVAAGKRSYQGKIAGIDFTVYLEGNVITNVHPRFPL